MVFIIDEIKIKMNRVQYYILHISTQYAYAPLHWLRMKLVYVWYILGQSRILIFMCLFCLLQILNILII